MVCFSQNLEPWNSVIVLEKSQRYSSRNITFMSSQGGGAWGDDDDLGMDDDEFKDADGGGGEGDGDGGDGGKRHNFFLPRLVIARGFPSLRRGILHSSYFVVSHCMQGC